MCIRILSASRAFACLIWLTLVLPSTLLSAESPAHVVILTSGETEPYQQAVSGFTSRLKEIIPGVTIDEHWTDGTESKIRSAVNTINTGAPAAIFVAGSSALRTIVQLDVQAPIVSALIVNSEEYASYQNITGVILEVPVTQQFRMLKHLIPDVRRIGVLYDPDTNQAKVEEAISIAEEEGLSINAIAIESPNELPLALKNLTRRVDAIWGVPDAMVMSSTTARHILLESFRNKVPLIGPSPSWTKAGAFYSLEWDFADIGKQSANMAIELINGKPVQSIPFSTPQKIGYSLNLKTARQMNIQLQDSVIVEATQVFE